MLHVFRIISRHIHFRLSVPANKMLLMVHIVCKKVSSSSETGAILKNSLNFIIETDLMYVKIHSILGMKK
jgi:hypothetical protein